MPGTARGASIGSSHCSQHGIEAIAVDLPGHGTDRGPTTDIHGDAARVAEALDRTNGPVVLLGHSYGGAVITEAGTHPSVRHLVYLAAFPIDRGESCVDAAAGEPGSERIDHTGRPNLAHAFVHHEDGTTTLTPGGTRECLYNDCDDDTIAWAVDHLDPQPMENLGQSPRQVASHERPSTYVVCANDDAVHPDLQRILARGCPRGTRVWSTGHSPFASQPALVAELLVELAVAG